MINVSAQSVGPSIPSGGNATSTHPIGKSSITVITDRQSYVTNDTITVTGTADSTPTVRVTHLAGIPNPIISKSQPIVIIRVYNSEQSQISVAQELVNANGTFSKQFLASGPLWQLPGLYTITVIQNATEAPVSTQFWFNYNGGSILEQSLPPTLPTKSTTPPIPTQPPISQPLPSNHTNPYVKCTNCINTDNNQSLTQSTQSTSTPITTTAKIPNWVKAVFGYYAQGNLSDDDLIKALQFLIQQGIIKLS